jgi:hypothetical protein
MKRTNLTPKQIERWVKKHDEELGVADRSVAGRAALALRLLDQAAFKQSPALQIAAYADLQAFAELTARVGR